MRRLIASAFLAVLLVGSQVGVVAAASTDNNVSYYTLEGKHGGKVSSSKLGSIALVYGPIPSGTTYCYYAYWTAVARNSVGSILFTYREQVEWCARNYKIVSATRWTEPNVKVGLVWQFASETLYEPSYNYYHSEGSFIARGTFNQVVPTIFGFVVVGQSHPRVRINITAWGDATGSISW